MNFEKSILFSRKLFYIHENEHTTTEEAYIGICKL